MMRFWLVTCLFCARFALLCASEPNGNSDSNDWMGRVLVVEDPAATVAFSAQPEPIRRMVENGMVAFTGKPDEKSAWLSLVSTNDKIGIKVFASHASSGTRKPVVEAIVRGLLNAGIPAKQITIWDRRLA